MILILSFTYWNVYERAFDFEIEKFTPTLRLHKSSNNSIQHDGMIMFSNQNQLFMWKKSDFYFNSQSVPGNMGFKALNQNNSQFWVIEQKWGYYDCSFGVRMEYRINDLGLGRWS